MTQEITRVGEDVEKSELSCTVGEYKLVKMLRKAIQQFFKTLKMKLPHDPAVPLLVVRPKETKAALEDVVVRPREKQLFTVAIMRKQPKCPSMVNRQETVICTDNRLVP